MADTRLVFGDVIFRGFEIPDRIVLKGGANTIHTHHLVGGKSVLGTDSPICTATSRRWAVVEGRFDGPAGQTPYSQASEARNLSISRAGANRRGIVLKDAAARALRGAEFQPVNLLLNPMKSIVADLTACAHCQEGTAGSLDRKEPHSSEGTRLVLQRVLAIRLCQ